MSTLNLDTWEWEEDEVEVPEEHNAQELLYALECPKCTGDMSPFFWKEYGICGDCHTESIK